MVYNILISFIILGIVVFIHELGHFIMAKKVGIEVRTFSVGFGPRIIGKMYKGTDYRISAIPLGGYVEMAGEELDDRKGGENEFASKTPWERFQVAFAGPFMNFVLAFLVIWIALMIGNYEPVDGNKVKIGWVEKGSVAEKAGILPGSEILSVNGDKVKDWKEFLNKVIFSKDKIKITWKYADKIKSVVLPIKRDPYTGMVNLGIAAGYKTKINAVLKGSPADKAGILKGDIIFSINGKEVYSPEAVSYIIHNMKKDSFFMTVERNGKKIEKKIIFDNNKKMLGVSLTPDLKFVLKKYDIFSAFIKAFEKLWGMIVQMFVVLKLLFSGAVSTKSMGGVIGIVQVTSKYASLGIASLLYFVGFISVNLGFVNLLPIPVADGGHITFIILEKLRGKPLSEKTMRIVMNLGLYLILFLFLFTTYNDIVRIIKGAF